MQNICLKISEIMLHIAFNNKYKRQFQRVTRFEIMLYFRQKIYNFFTKSSVFSASVLSKMCILQTRYLNKYCLSSYNFGLIGRRKFFSRNGFFIFSFFVLFFIFCRFKQKLVIFSQKCVFFVPILLRNFKSKILNDKIKKPFLDIYTQIITK